MNINQLLQKNAIESQIYNGKKVFFSNDITKIFGNII